MYDLSGKVALITGGARGQGEAEARLFAELGAKVIIADVRDELGQGVAAAIGPGATYVHLDVSSENDWTAAIELVRDRHGRLDALINNAGIFVAGWLESETLDNYMKTIMVNQVGCFLGMRAAVPMMKEQGGGSIINVGSSTSVIASPGPALAYTGSKFAIRGMTKCASIELGRYDIRVNLLIPGAMRTPQTMEDEVVLAANESFASRQPIPRMGLPIDCAHMAAFLASDASAFCTGGDFAVDGGFTAGHLLGAA